MCVRAKKWNLCIYAQLALNCVILLAVDYWLLHAVLFRQFVVSWVSMCPRSQSQNTWYSESRVYAWGIVHIWTSLLVKGLIFYFSSRSVLSSVCPGISQTLRLVRGSFWRIFTSWTTRSISSTYRWDCELLQSFGAYKQGGLEGSWICGQSLEIPWIYRGPHFGVDLWYPEYRGGLISDGTWIHEWPHYLGL